jgi:hypothetical protein
MLANLSELYGADPSFLEISLCDDGTSREPERLDLVRIAEITKGRVRVRVSLLPDHELPRCSALAINAAVEASTAPIVVIQNPETTHHDARVLHQIELEVEADPSAYVVSSCWEADLAQWYEHPVHRRKGLHWCVGMRRELWRRAGGIDLGLMAGHAYEDNDLRNRMHRAGARFVHREDLLVNHRKSLQEKYEGRRGAQDSWDAGLVQVNRERYLSTWGTYWPDHGGDGE